MIATKKRGQGCDFLDLHKFFGRLGCQHNFRDNAVPAYFVHFRLVVDLLIDQRRQHVSRTNHITGDTMFRAFKSRHLTEPYHAVFSRNIGGFER